MNQECPTSETTYNGPIAVSELEFAGVRVSLALSFVLLFAAEMINARSGLGFLIRQAENGLRFDLMYVSILTIAVLGYLGDRLLRATRRRMVAWQEMQGA